MKKRLLLFSAVVGLVGLVALGAVLGLAGTSNAASTNTCQVVNGAPNCLSVGVFPAQLNATGQGLIVAKFINQGPATATHTAIKVTLPGNVTATLVQPTPANANCSGTTSPITCSFGNIGGFATAKVAIVFTTTAAAGTTLSGSGVTATLTYAEGNDNNGTPTNDQFSTSGNDISIVDGSSQGGYCTTSTGNHLLSTNLGGQTTEINTLSSLLGGGLPCTPISAGTLANPGNLNCGAKKCASPVSFVIVPTTGTASVTVPVAPLPSGTKASNFQLYWFSETGTTGIALSKCSDTLKLPPVNTPKPTPGTDTCVQAQTDINIKGTKYIKVDLTIFGTTLIDSKFAG